MILLEGGMGFTRRGYLACFFVLGVINLLKPRRGRMKVLFIKFAKGVMPEEKVDGLQMRSPILKSST